MRAPQPWRWLWTIGRWRRRGRESQSQGVLPSGTFDARFNEAHKREKGDFGEGVGRRILCLFKT